MVAPGDWLSAVARLDLPIAPLLDVWVTGDGDSALRGLAELVDQWGTALDEGDPAPPYWIEAAVAVRDLMPEWLFNAATRDRLLPVAGDWPIDRAIAVPKERGPDRL